MNRFVKALESKYQAKIDESIAVIELYLSKPVGVGEHSDILSILDENIGIIENNKSKIQILSELITPVAAQEAPVSQNVDPKI